MSHILCHLTQYRHSVKTCVVHNDDRKFFTITNIGKAGSLKSLILYAYQGENLQEFAHLAKLQDLRVYHSRLQSLNGIENLTALKYLDIAYAKNLQNISALDRLEAKHAVDKVILPKKFKRK